ncbi:kinase-like domain-containing protein [Rhizophagus irregularis DAOM 181602=DAOM 197198]|uniref:Kinase-like domain-containing protein n=3 Tax=Rhizophagus irregularis TaxID=588596 RepID=U9SLT8_RHIID|nr:kinase-like domain-containing protein [Rhizophagus irregularis DAOM 181602=DAOM 197198]EXX58121.1 Ipl1p [Rhizophagus irregularis DAOM 197198w]POG66908.1 kinase-like domain-containing protein [Rhizophagus irregularis DAOM 181602=DAOM 197198]|eukprot:XP_025173774.1 kinase-like domain-containing protein [Rhizophagus irregularis DAOM 181602=DAOM 197198]
MEMVNSHPNIIQFHGLTKLQDEKNYSLVLEYAEGGTLRKYLRNDAISFEWESQLRFAKDIASAISWLHDDMGIIHGDLHPNNILINKGTIKIADFGCSYLKGSNRNTQVQGVIPYMDPNFFEQRLCSSETQRHPYPLAEKADIYSLGVLFWELTSRKMPFDFETKNNDPFEIIKIKSNILKGMREKPSPGTNHKFVALYEKCWQHKPDVRPEIRQVILELNNIEPLVVSENFGFKEIETMEKSGTLENDEVNVPSYDCDINKYNL